mmetsp:Transcript_26587/g.48705  ORF Transcript_26587/g.48705 Transcript_26587/m.48705 type:complete len:449 (-) Transcript_26587:151-1497(-)
MLAWLLLCISIPTCLAAWQSVDPGETTCSKELAHKAVNALIQHAKQQANNMSLTVAGQDAGTEVRNPGVVSQMLEKKMTEEDKAFAEVARSKCLGNQLQNACLPKKLEHTNTLQYLRVESSLTSQPMLGTGEELVKRMHNEYNQRLGRLRLGWHGDEMVHKESWDAFESLRTLDAREVLSFRETWTDEDTELLKALDDSNDTYTKGQMTTEKFQEYLPSIKVLEALVGKNRSVAIVGGGPSMKSHGSEIDEHDVVVRFNHHVDKALNDIDTGKKMNVHVLNWMIDYGPEPGVLHLDLESTSPGLSYCRRWYKAANSSGSQWDQVPLMVRPSAFCGLRKMWGFTRGFMFYWLVGRLFDRVDLYGMNEDDAAWHYGEGMPVQEPFLQFEHLLYSTARKMQAEQEQMDERLHHAIRPNKQNRPAASMAEVDAVVEHHKQHRFNMYPWPEEA